VTPDPVPQSPDESLALLTQADHTTEEELYASFPTLYHIAIDPPDPPQPTTPPQEPDHTTYPQPPRQRHHPFAIQHKLRVGDKTFDAGRDAYVDDGACLNVLDWAFYGEHEDTIGPMRRSTLSATVANGMTLASKGTVTITVCLESGGKTCTADADFEVLETADSWSLLLGRPWLTQIGGHTMVPP